MNRFKRDVSSFVLLAALSTSFLHADNWPGWRGPNRSALSAETNIPTKWSATEGIAWKVPVVGGGISSPVVWEDKIFLAAADGYRQRTLHISCRALADGRELWHQKFWGTAPTRHHGAKSSMASPTPITDGKNVYAFFGTGDVFCVDVNGNLVWYRSLATEYSPFENRFAASSSPVLYKDLLLLQCDHYGDSYAIAIDKHTGANRWRVERPDAWLSWSSPQLVEVQDAADKELILCGSTRVEALDPRTGAKLWTVHGMAHECIPSPVVGHGLIYAVSGPKGPTLAIQPGGRGDVTESRVKWRNDRGAPFVPSAILVGDQYYLIDDQGVTTCLDAHNGTRVWRNRLPGGYTASPVAAENRVYFTNEQGTTVVVEGGLSKYKEVARNALGEAVYASPAISQGRIFIRTTGHLYCIDSAQ